MDIDFSNIDTEKSFTLYDSGPQRVCIKSIEEVVASSGNDQLRIKTNIIGGEYDGKQLTDHITLVSSCDWKLGKFIQSCGIDIKALGSMDSISREFRKLLNKLVGKTSVWVVDQQTKKGSTELRNVVTDYQVDPDARTPGDDAPDFIKEEDVVWDEEEPK